jgi:hypothetical protein
MISRKLQAEELINSEIEKYFSSERKQSLIQVK